MTINRREIITAPALAAAASIPAAFALGASPASAEGQTLAGMIEAHRLACERRDVAQEVEDEIEFALRSEPAPRVPCNVLNDGSSSGYYELRPLNSDEIRGFILKEHKRYREQHCNAWTRRLAPGSVDEMEANIAASEARALQALADAEVAIEARRRDSGLAEASELADKAADEEEDLRFAIAVYRPANATEARMKADYIAGSDRFQFMMGDQPIIAFMIEKIDEQAVQS